jgi:hypothetical protein
VGCLAFALFVSVFRASAMLKQQYPIFLQNRGFWKNNRIFS